MNRIVNLPPGWMPPVPAIREDRFELGKPIPVLSLKWLDIQIHLLEEIARNRTILTGDGLAFLAKNIRIFRKAWFEATAEDRQYGPVKVMVRLGFWKRLWRSIK